MTYDMENDYNTLKELEKYFSRLNFNTSLYSVSDEIPVPLLIIAISVDDSLPMGLNMAFTPFPNETVESSRFLQMSVELPVYIAESENAKILEFANIVNASMPLGNFMTLEDSICCKYTCAIGIDDTVTAPCIIETISLFSWLALIYGKIFMRLAENKISIEEAKKEFLNVFK